MSIEDIEAMLADHSLNPEVRIVGNHYAVIVDDQEVAEDLLREWDVTIIDTQTPLVPGTNMPDWSRTIIHLAMEPSSEPDDSDEDQQAE